MVQAGPLRPEPWRKAGTREQRAQSARTIPNPAEMQKTEQSDDRLVLLANP
jgi:hypothetical protein